MEEIKRKHMSRLKAKAQALNKLTQKSASMLGKLGGRPKKENNGSNLLYRVNPGNSIVR